MPAHARDRSGFATTLFHRSQHSRLPDLRCQILWLLLSAVSGVSTLVSGPALCMALYAMALPLSVSPLRVHAYTLSK